MAIPAAVALILHFVLYHRPVRIGKTFFGVLAVAVAVSAAGLFSGAGYSPTVIFYTISLGVGMVLAYLLIASDLSSSREYDVAEAFSGMMISVGFYATLLLLLLWIRELRHAGFAEMYIQPANNLGTFLLFALPFPLYFVWRAEGRRKLLPAFLFLLFFAALLLSTSRGAWCWLRYLPLYRWFSLPLWMKSTVGGGSCRRSCSAWFASVRRGRPAVSRSRFAGGKRV